MQLALAVLAPYVVAQVAGLLGLPPLYRVAGFIVAAALSAAIGAISAWQSLALMVGAIGYWMVSVALYHWFKISLFTREL